MDLCRSQRTHCMFFRRRTWGGVWPFKNSGSRKILVEFHRSTCSSLVFVAVMFISQSPSLYKALSEPFVMLRNWRSWFVYLSLNEWHLLVTNSIMNFKIASFKFPRKCIIIITSHKLSECHKKLQNLPQCHFRAKNIYMYITELSSLTHWEKQIQPYALTLKLY